MGALEEFKATIGDIAADINGGSQSYSAANVRLDMATSELLAAYIVETPDSILDETFTAYAQLHVLAAQKGLITSAEAGHLINDRAEELFEDYRGWEAVEAMVKPYWDKLDPETMDGEAPINAL